MRDRNVIDITSRDCADCQRHLRNADPAVYVRAVDGIELGYNRRHIRPASLATTSALHFLAPVRPAGSQGLRRYLRPIDGGARDRGKGGGRSRPCPIHPRDRRIIGNSLRNIKAGSPQAAQVKQALIAEGLWSQYLEVGIGPDAEVFSKAQVLSSVGTGAEVGIASHLALEQSRTRDRAGGQSSPGRIVGATLGNDVNLRDVEGRSALLLSKAKDNNAACAIGPLHPAVRCIASPSTMCERRS